MTQQILAKIQAEAGPDQIVSARLLPELSGEPENSQDVDVDEKVVAINP